MRPTSSKTKITGRIIVWIAFLVFAGSSPAVAWTCESQADNCRPCQNGRATLNPNGACWYDNVQACRQQIIAFCQHNKIPQHAAPRGHGALSTAEVNRLIMSCPQVPHGSLIPYAAAPPAPGTLDAQRCEAFGNLYRTCAMLFVFGRKQFTQRDLQKCLRDGYTGP